MIREYSLLKTMTDLQQTRCASDIYVYKFKLSMAQNAACCFSEEQTTEVKVAAEYQF